LINPLNENANKLLIQDQQNVEDPKVTDAIYLD